MGFFDFLSSSDEDGEESGGAVRYLSTFEGNYDSMEEFKEDFYEMVDESIQRYNEANPMKAKEFDRNNTFKEGGRWIYEAKIQEVRDESLSVEAEKEDRITGESTFKVMAREQPNFGIEVSGTETLVEPYLKEMREVLSERGLKSDFSVIARPGLGKAQQPETESAA